jgi:hypothetical protein
VLKKQLFPLQSQAHLVKSVWDECVHAGLSFSPKWNTRSTSPLTTCLWLCIT